uniref:Truncated ATP synthase F0 subunit 8 n=1 Tax=Pyganodon grandis TaxID=96932 RepID=D2DW53_PYGGR|nr:truncated ATP synthase F0 subunit 8 [Pyganodon grandis]
MPQLSPVYWVSIFFL